MTRLQTIFQLYLLRRRKDSELDGKKLIELPKKTIELCALEFTQEERDIYDVVGCLTRPNVACSLKRSCRSKDAWRPSLTDSSGQVQF